MAYVSRIAKGEPLTYEEMDGNFQEMDAQFVAAEGFALDAQGSAIEAQNAADSAQSIIDDAVEQYEFEVEDNANRIRNLEYGDGPYPSLDLLFTGAKSVDPRLVVERPSPKWVFNERGLLVEVPPNMPAIDYDPATGKSLGLLVEGQVTNLAVPSYWPTGTRVGIDLGGSVSLGDALSIKEFIEDSSDGSHYVTGPAISRVSGNSYTETFYAKSAGRRVYVFSNASVLGGNTAFRFKLDTGEVEQQLNGTAKMTHIGGGVWRCQFTVTAVESGAFSWRYYAHNGTTFSYPGDGSSGFLIGGLQCEEGTHPTSYIPTEGSQVTRAAPNTSVPLALSPIGNSFVADFVVDANFTAFASERRHIFSFVKQGDLSRICYVYLESRGLYVVYQDGQGDTIKTRTLVNFTPITGQRYKIAVAFDGQNVYASINGGSVDSVDAPLTFSEFDTLYLGQQGETSQRRYLYGTLGWFAYYPRRLPNAQLQVLTS